MSHGDSPAGLTAGETALLADAESDDVSFDWVLIRLGILENPPPHTKWRPSEADLAEAFASLERLVERKLIRVGRIEYIDGGAPGRLAPVRHVEEPLDVVRARVTDEVRRAVKETDWAFSCWVVHA